MQSEPALWVPPPRITSELLSFPSARSHLLLGSVIRFTSNRLLAVATVVALITGCKTIAPEVTADTIYTAGDIVTVNDSQPAAEAVAVKNGRILAVGARSEVEAAHKGRATTVVDLGGKTLVPGFVDGHAHFNGFGAQAVGANLLAPPDGMVNNIDDVVAKLKEFAQGPDLARTGWIYGVGYDDAVLAEGRHPTREDLDKVSTDIPVMVVHISGHFSVVNTVGLKQIGYTAATKDPPGGKIRRVPGRQEPNGVLEEMASLPHTFKLMTPTKAEDQAYFTQKGLELAKSFGYTTAQEGRALANTHAALAGLADKGAFDIDIVSYIDFTDRKLLESPWHSGDYRNHYRIAGMKITLDGSPQGRTAWRTTPYLLPPDGQKAGYKGYPAIADDAVVAGLLDEAYQKNWQVLTHANGDAAIDQLIRAMRPAQNKYGPGDRRHVLIHGQFVRQDQLDSLKELQVIPSLFPMHTFYWGDWYDKIVGPNQAQQISPMRSARTRRMIVTSHTDAPVALPNLMQVMSATVNRTSRSGKVMGPEERLTPLEALKTFTIWGAYQHFEEHRKGSIEVGKLADLVILSDNPLTIDPARILYIKVLETIKEGRTVYTARGR